MAVESGRTEGGQTCRCVLFEEMEGDVCMFEQFG